MWDADQYARYASERSRPFVDLMARVRPEREPRLVVDLGCGDGPLTLSLAERWPGATVIGIDSSPQMLDAARRLDADARVEWIEADVADPDPAQVGRLHGADVIVSNAALQWVPRHRDLFATWIDSLAPGGWFAMQVPGNYHAPSHALMRAAAAQHRRAAELAEPLSRLRVVGDPAEYATLLAACGASVDAWETTYLHALDPNGETANPVLEWVRGTGLRPALDVLTEPIDRDDFLRDYGERLLAAYPRTPIGVLLGFRRIFAVAHRDQ